MATTLADDIFMNFESNLIEVCSWGANEWYGSIGPGNGLAPYTWQAIT